MLEHWKLQTNKMLEQKNALLNPNICVTFILFTQIPCFESIFRLESVDSRPKCTTVSLDSKPKVLKKSLAFALPETCLTDILSSKSNCYN